MTKEYQQRQEKADNKKEDFLTKLSEKSTQKLMEIIGFEKDEKIHSLKDIDSEVSAYHHLEESTEFPGHPDFQHGFHISRPDDAQFNKIFKNCIFHILAYYSKNGDLKKKYWACLKKDIPEEFSDGPVEALRVFAKLLNIAYKYNRLDQSVKEEAYEKIQKIKEENRNAQEAAKREKRKEIRIKENKEIFPQERLNPEIESPTEQIYRVNHDSDVDSGYLPENKYYALCQGISHAFLKNTNHEYSGESMDNLEYQGAEDDPKFKKLIQIKWRNFLKDRTFYINNDLILANYPYKTNAEQKSE